MHTYTDEYDKVYSIHIDMAIHFCREIDNIRHITQPFWTVLIAMGWLLPPPTVALSRIWEIIICYIHSSSDPQSEVSRRGGPFEVHDRRVVRAFYM